MFFSSQLYVLDVHTMAGGKLTLKQPFFLAKMDEHHLIKEVLACLKAAKLVSISIYIYP